MQTNILGKYSTRDLPRERTILTYSQRERDQEKAFSLVLKRQEPGDFTRKERCVNKGADATLSSEDVWPKNKVQYSLELQDLSGDSGARERVH